MKHFKDRVAVITGAASGIGRAIAERCASEGMRVVLAGINEDRLLKVETALKAQGATVISVRTDVSKQGEVEALAQKTLDAFGAVHLLVNNAGVVAGSGVVGSTWNDWEWVMGVNLWGVIYGTKIFTPLMQAQKEPCHIVNISSLSGLIAYQPSAPYQVTKHAVVALSENLQLALERQQSLVKVSVLCPGWVRTGILDARRNQPDELHDAPVPLTPAMEEAWKTAQAAMEAGLPPEQVANQVFAAIEEERFYILTHPEHNSMIAERMNNILAGANPRMPY